MCVSGWGLFVFVVLCSVLCRCGVFQLTYLAGELTLKAARADDGVLGPRVRMRLGFGEGVDGSEMVELGERDAGGNGEEGRRTA